MNNKMVFHIISLMTFFLIICGCYTPESSTGVEILPGSIKTVAIPTITNKTPYYGINEELTRELTEKFIQNGRLTVADKKEADCMLECEIVRYLLVPLSYDENDVVEQKKLNVIVNLTFIDLQNETKMWDEIWRETDAGTEIGGIIEEVSFFVSGDEDETETEQEARARIVIELAEDIVQRTIYGW